MKRITGLLFLLQALILGVAVHAQENHGRGDRKRGDDPVRSATEVHKAQVQRQAPARQPIAIRAERPGRGDDSRQERKPSYDRTQNSSPAARPSKDRQRPAYTKPYDRQRVSRLGIRVTPQPIRESSALLRTNRSRSVIQHPQTGPKGERIRGSMIHPRKFNNRTVKSQMSIVIQPSFNLRLDQERRRENQRNRNYWHSDRGFNYNHYIDNWGTHWYGWYRGNQYFWTRHHNGRWWWHDTDYDRWCYYQDNNWYWQDPHRQDDIYAYDNDSYISLSFDFHN